MFILLLVLAFFDVLDDDLRLIVHPSNRGRHRLRDTAGVA
jgi:hypothetical protein